MRYWEKVYKTLILETFPAKIAGFKNKNLKHSLRLLFLPVSFVSNLKHLKKSKNIIASMNLVVTTKCTLRCKDCLHLIPYHKCPKDVPYEEIEKNVQKLLKMVDIIGTITILGGEPFIYKDIDQILKLLISEKKVKKIAVTTNGTVMPKESTLKLLHNPKIIVIVSNYGAISKKVTEIKEIFQKYKVAYFAEPYHDWISAGGMEKRGYSKTEMESMFTNCFNAFHCASFYKDKLVSCPRELNLELLGVQKAAKESIVISDIKNREEMNAALMRFYNMKYTPACNYCDIGTEKGKLIPCAQQIEKMH